MESYIKRCDVCLVVKAWKHKPYGDLQSLLVPTHRQKDFSLDFVTCLPVITNWKGETYDSILVIVDQLTKMVHYKPVKMTIDALALAEVIIEAVMWHYSFSESIFSD